jgi:hypothetical protein
MELDTIGQNTLPSHTQTEATYEGVIINRHFPHILYNLEFPADKECRFMFIYFEVSVQKIYNNLRRVTYHFHTDIS